MARKVRVTVDHNGVCRQCHVRNDCPKVFVLNEQRQSEAVNPEGIRSRRSWMQQRTVPSAPSSWRMQRQENDCSRNLHATAFSFPLPEGEGTKNAR